MLVGWCIIKHLELLILGRGSLQGDIASQTLALPCVPLNLLISILCIDLYWLCVLVLDPSLCVVVGIGVGSSLIGSH